MSDINKDVTSNGGVQLDEDNLDAISGGPTAVENILATGLSSVTQKVNTQKIEIGALKFGV